MARSRSRKGTAELTLLLGTTALSLFIAGLALVGIRFLSGAQEYHDMGGYHPPMDGGSYGGYTAPVTAPTTTAPTTTTTTPTPSPTKVNVDTPESLFDKQFSAELQVYDTAGVAPCSPWQVTNTPRGIAWKEDPATKPSVVAIAYDKTKKFLEKYDATIGSTGEICPDPEQLQEEQGLTAVDFDEECQDAIGECDLRTKAARIQADSPEDWEAWGELMLGCLARNDLASPACIDDFNLDAFTEDVSYERRGQTCYGSHDDCRSNGEDAFCKATEGTESLSRADRLAASLLGREGPQGVCELLGEGQCVIDADCDNGEVCLYPSMPCLDADSCALNTGTCMFQAHPAPEEEVSGEEMLTEDHPVTLQEVQEELTEELGREATPKEALEEFNKQLEEVLVEHEKETGDEVTPEDYAKWGLQDPEAQADAIVAQTSTELAPLFSDAVLKLVSLSSAEGLSEEARTEVREGLEVVGGQLQALAEGGGVDVDAVIEALEEVHDVLPPELIVQFEEETRDERVEDALGGVRFELRNVEEMLTWIKKFIDALREVGYTDGDLDLWSRLVETAIKMFYEEMLPKCERLFDELREGVAGNMEQCFDNVEALFDPLGKSMRGDIEADMSNGNEKVMEAMMIAGRPPSGMMGDDHGGGMPGGPGGPGMDPEYCFDACEQRLGITDLIDRSDNECVKPQAPECIEEESDSPECEALFNACDLQILGPDISQALSYCQDACARGMGGERQEGYDMRDQQRMQSEHFTEMYMNAALSCCSMDRGGDFSCIDNFLPPMALQFHPDIPLPGVDEACPEQEGYGADVCGGPWDGMHEDCDRYGQMDPMCMLEHLRYFPDECKPPADDPIWNVGDMRQGTWQSETMNSCGEAQMHCYEQCQAEECPHCDNMCGINMGDGYMHPGPMPYPGMPGMPGGMYPGGTYPGGMPYPSGPMYPGGMPYQGGMTCEDGCRQYPPPGKTVEQCIADCGTHQGGPMYPGMPNQGYSLDQCTRDKAACVDGCGTDTACMSRCPMCPVDGGTMYPSGMYPSGTYPTGTYPTGTYPTGTYPTGTYPTGTYPTGTYPTGTYPTGTYPTGTYPTGTYPTGTYPTGTYPTYPTDGTYTPPTYIPPTSGEPYPYTPPPTYTEPAPTSTTPSSSNGSIWDAVGSLFRSVVAGF